MAYLALYRKYRSQAFGELIGQSHVVRTLQGAISSGRISHAYLFTGPRGTGKTSTARLFAKALCCEKGPTAEPCNACDICREITTNSCMDVVELDAASEAGVQDVRDNIVNIASYMPGSARYRIFIIDEVHDLSSSAFDALLKTIEEPPAHLIFILATTEFHKVPPTIRSRCQKLEFHRASLKDIVQQLEGVAKAEGLTADPAALTAIARMADGGYRDALTLLEQVISSGETTVTVDAVYDQLGLITDEAIDRILSAIVRADIDVIISSLTDFFRQGRDPRSILDSAMYRLGDLTRALYGAEPGEKDSTRGASLHDGATQIGAESLLHLRGMIAEAHKVIRDVSLPHLWLEAELVRIALGPKSVAKASSQSHMPAASATPATPKAAVAETRAQAHTPPVPHESDEPKAAKPKLASPPPPVEAKSGKNVSPEAAEAWQTAVQALSLMSASMRMKLSGATLSSFEGDTAQVNFDRALDLDFFEDEKMGATRKQAVVNELSKAIGKKIELKLQLAKKTRKTIEPETVELPVEGDQLVQLAKETFQIS